MSVELCYQRQLAHPQQVNIPAQVCCRPLSRLICAIKRIEIFALSWFKSAFLMSNNQTSLQLTHDLLSDDGQKITFVLSRAAEQCIVAYCPLLNITQLSELDKFALIAPNKVIPLTHMNDTNQIVDPCSFWSPSSSFAFQPSFYCSQQAEYHNALMCEYSHRKNKFENIREFCVQTVCLGSTIGII